MALYDELKEVERSLVANDLGRKRGGVSEANEWCRIELWQNEGENEMGVHQKRFEIEQVLRKAACMTEPRRLFSLEWKRVENPIRNILSHRRVSICLKRIGFIALKEYAFAPETICLICGENDYVCFMRRINMFEWDDLFVSETKCACFNDQCLIVCERWGVFCLKRSCLVCERKFYLDGTVWVWSLKAFHMFENVSTSIIGKRFVSEKSTRLVHSL